MHWILWAALSFVAGWSIHALFFPIAPPPAPQQQPPTDLFGSLRALSRGRGWEVRITPPPESPPQTPDQIPDGFRQVLLFLLGIVTVVFLLVVSFLQAIGNQDAYNFEEGVATQRFVFVLFWAATGFLASAFRDILVGGAKAAFKYVLTNKDDTILWPVQAVLAIGLLLGTLLAINPRLVDKLTSFKAGNVEAQFSANSSKLRSAPVKLLDVQQKITLSVWNEFKLIPHSIAQQIIYAAEHNDGDWPTPDQSTTRGYYRATVYKTAGAKAWRVALAQVLFEKQLNPLFNTIKCFEDIGEIEVIKSDRALNEFALDYSYLKKGTSIGRLEEINFLRKLGKHSREIQRNFEGQLNSKSSDPLFQSVRGCLRKTFPPSLDPCTEDDLYEVSAKIPSADEKNNLWDPYLIAAVADLLGFTQSQRARADFLEAIRVSVIDKDSPCTADCVLSIPGLTSFYFALTDAKIKSEAPWPVNESVNDIRTALAALDEILDSAKLKARASPADNKGTVSEIEADEIQNKYRLSKLLDLAIGLEIYYQRVLGGEILSDSDLSQWRSWLDETRRILSVAKRAGFLGGMSETEVTAWHNAEPALTESALFDAATSASISLVLLPHQNGSPSSEECLAARSLHNYAKSIDLCKGSDAACSNTIAGFLVQVSNRISTDCE